MRKSKFTEEQILRILKEGTAEGKVGELCRRHNISKGTYYSWKSKYGGLEISELRRLRALEEENSKLKRLLADAQLDIFALKDVLHMSIHKMYNDNKTKISRLLQDKSPVNRN